MHRMNILGRLAKRGRRIPVLGTAAHLFVRTGVRATYYLHDRLLSNPVAKKRYTRRPPALDAAQEAIVTQLAEEGLAVTSFRELFGEDRWKELAKSAAEFAHRVERNDAAPDAEMKQYLVRAYAPGPIELSPRNPWLRFGADPRLLAIVNAYLRLWSKLSYVDLWYTRLMPEAADRVASQRWHRDYNDRYLLKVFLYMNDVDDGGGPFEYVPGSMADGTRYADVFPWEVFGEHLYPSESELRARIPPSASRVLTGPAGTMIFCNTTGFHRGGFATAQPRLMGVCNYVSPASLASLSERNYTVSELPPDAAEPVRYALR